MIDWNKPIQTRDRRKAEYRGKFNNLNGPYRHIVVVTGPQSSQYVDQFTDEGKPLLQPGFNDIINVPKELEGWVNIYSLDSAIDLPKRQIWGSKWAANNNADEGRIACISIKFAEGDGLEDAT